MTHMLNTNSTKDQVVQIIWTCGTSSGETGITWGSARKDLLAAAMWVFLGEILRPFFSLLLSSFANIFAAKLKGFSLSTRCCRDPELGHSNEPWIDLVATTWAIGERKLKFSESIVDGKKSAFEVKKWQEQGGWVKEVEEIAAGFGENGKKRSRRKKRARERELGLYRRNARNLGFSFALLFENSWECWD